MIDFEQLLANLTQYRNPAECFNAVTLAFGFKSPKGEASYGPSYGYYSKSFNVYGLKMPNTYELRRKYMCE